MRGKKTKTVKFLRREGIVPALPIVLVGSFTTFYCDFIRIRRLKVVYKESRTFSVAVEKQLILWEIEFVQFYFCDLCCDGGLL